MEQLIAVDREIFFFINQGLSNPLFDLVMPIFRNMFTWFPLYLFLIIFLIRNYKKRGLVMVAVLFLNFGISDWVSSSWIKNSVQRIRPCNDIELRDQITVRARCGGGYSFTSSHATNHFALAVMLIVLLYRRWKPILWVSVVWASTIGFAQIYVGVHYPGDVVVGSLLGASIGLLTGTIYKRLDQVVLLRQTATA